MDRSEATHELLVRANIGRHLAFAPVAFAVTEGSSHTVLYANAVFLALQSAGKISMGPVTAQGASSAV